VRPDGCNRDRLSLNNNWNGSPLDGSADACALSGDVDGQSGRSGWLSAEELSQFTGALDAYHDQNAANALRLLLLTGARAGEVLKADWTQFDLERAVWTKPSHHTKQKQIEHVPLSPPALEMLSAMKPKGAIGPLFLGRTGSKARVSLRQPWVQACKAAGLAEAITLKGKRRRNSCTRT
jgi:integrase